MLSYDQSQLYQLIQLRIAVAILGEETDQLWWNTKFYSTSADTFLLPIFTKTHLLTKYTSTTAAARLVHDHALTGNCYHLFRLLEEQEIQLHEKFLSLTETEVDALPTDKSTASHTLKKLDQLPNKKWSIGPNLVSPKSSDDFITLVASCYNFAFSSDMKMYPYVTGITW